MTLVILIPLLWALLLLCMSIAQFPPKPPHDTYVAGMIGYEEIAYCKAECWCRTQEPGKEKPEP